jgi:hypothetical protein
MSKLIFKGKGSGQYITGIPTRDLTEEEMKALPQDLIAQAISSGLYAEDEKPKKEAVNG